MWISVLRYYIYVSHYILFNSFVYYHKYLPFDLRDKYYPYYVEGFENKQIQKKEDC